MTESGMSAQEWNHKGCEESRKGNLSEALSYYSNALNLTEDKAEKACLYRNRADIYFQLSDYEKVINDCNSALKICCSKALLQRCKALEALERFEEAYQDAKIIIALNPNNEDFQRLVDHLREIVQERRNKDKISVKVSEALDLALDANASEKEREIAMNNLFLLAYDEAGAEEIFKKEGVSKMVQLVKVEENEEVICSAIRIVAELCKNNISRTKSVMKYVGLPWCLEMIDCTSIRRVNASQYCLQNILNTYSGMNSEPDSKPDEALCAAHKKEIDTILLGFSSVITNRTLTGLARDAIIELIMRNIYCVTTLDWVNRFIELRGVQRLMEVASEMEEYYFESSLNVTSSTQTIISACLAKIHEIYDEKTFINAVDEFIEDKLKSPDIESRVRVVVAITALLLGPSDVGNAVVAKEEILEMILVMAETDDVLQQEVALQCVVAAMIKKDKARAIVNQGVDILKKLCQSKDDFVRVRALVGLCKLSNSGDSDATIRPLAYGVTKELTEACKRLLVNSKKGNRKWAIKGLSYLTFNTGVKRELIENLEVIDTMVEIEIAETGDRYLFDVLTTLINLCDAYDEQEPEMIELSKFVKYHFSEESELDDDYFEQRLGDLLIDYDVITYLLKTAENDNQNCKELIARILNAICSKEGLANTVVYVVPQTLLSLALDGTVKGKKQASLALVRLALTKSIVPDDDDADDIVPAQLLVEFVQPIVNLLNLECSVNENCQILTALYNLAEFNDSIREHMFKEEVFQKIEAFVHEGDYLLRLVSSNLINLLISSRSCSSSETDGGQQRSL